MDIKRTLITASALALATAGPTVAAPSGTVDVQILAVYDFHGNLSPPSGSSGRVGTLDAGGAVDADALESYFATFSPVAPGPRNRIVVLP
jgi:5'-nucleotidase